jgi:hypothetical protein
MLQCNMIELYERLCPCQALLCAAQKFGQRPSDRERPVGSADVEWGDVAV